MDDVEEGRLVEQARSGDLEASNELIRRHRDRIYRTIQRFTRNQSDADDLFQETFLRAFKELGSFGRRSRAREQSRAKRKPQEKNALS